MTQIVFDQIPSEFDLLKASRQIDREIAAQIVHYSLEWGNDDREQQLKIINMLVNAIDTRGKDDWQAILWDCLMERINQLSNKINTNVHEIKKSN